MSMGSTFTGLARYGLSENPYRVAPLDPLRNGHELSERIGIIGGLKSVESYIEHAAQAGETAFVLVQGKGGTGRTSVCNHLLRHHCAARQVEPARFVVPDSRFKGQGQDSFDIFKCWLIALHGKLKRAKLTPLGEDFPSLEEDLSTVGNLQREVFPTQVAQSLGDLAEVLDAKSAAFGACFENVRDFSLVNAAFEAFVEARTLVLFTILDYPRRRDGISVLYESHNPEARSIDGHYPILKLETIRGEIAKELVQFHWKRAKPNIESPFDDAGLVEVFDDQSRPAGRVVLLTQGALESHAQKVSPGPVWPADRENLAFERNRLCELIPRIDRDLPEPFDD